MRTNQYDVIAGKYDSLFNDRKSIEENRKVSNMLRRVRGSVIDAGCGTGLLLEMKKMNPSRYIGIDPSSKMIDILRKKHPGYQVVNIPFEWLNLKAVNFSSVVALFGSASYIKEQSLRRIPKRKQVFLMFYKEDYHPVTYQLTGKEMDHFTYSRNTLADMFPHCRIKVFNNYYIVTNV